MGNPIRLLKGAPPGQEAVNHYISELSIEKKHNTKLSDKQRKHLVMLEACDDEYNYHYKLFGQGAVDRDKSFCLSVCLPICLSVCLSVCLCLCQRLVCLSVC